MSEEEKASKEMVELRFGELEKRYDQLNTLNQAAVKNALDSINYRLEAMNEFRAQMKDQQSNYFTTKEHNIFMDKIDGEIHLLQIDKATLAGKASQTAVVVAYIVSFVSLLIAVVSFAMKLMGK